MQSEELVPQAADEEAVPAGLDTDVAEDGLDHVHHVAHQEALDEVESLHPAAPAVRVLVLPVAVEVDGVEAVDAVNVEVGGPRHEAVVAAAAAQRDLRAVDVVAARPRPRGRGHLRAAVKLGGRRGPAARVRHDSEAIQSWCKTFGSQS